MLKTLPERLRVAPPACAAVRYNPAMVRANDTGRPVVLSHDSSPESQALQVELWRRMSTVERTRIISALTRSVQELSLAGIRRRNPGATDRECMLRLAALKLGMEMTLEAYPDAADLLNR